MNRLILLLLFFAYGCKDNTAELSSENRILTQKVEEQENELEKIEKRNSEEKKRSDAEKVRLVEEVAELKNALKKIELEKKERSLSFLEKEKVLNQFVSDLENAKISLQRDHEKFIDSLMLEHKETIARLKDEIRKADAEGYRRGIDFVTRKIDKSRGL